ncbi:pimeloyl-ACP methyl ester carboxylesterase [Lipingzhangella halophila]|uniref:Pimeloyl-ACP methyl ester carboxylesterase n=1 Tax=Lipingzhangella halophila TaxID=1783352 RepID=A0A7W7W469_9ACTN|nr:alpha/beta fold hydrolase [Lipingzhangella halophila]MBB4933496.1 pimeloyl-ACP methyl ester carboxylesterase [Lipingzhangella halophila]
MQTFTASDGTAIAYRVWDRESSFPLVVLHHGFIADGLINWVGPGVVDALLDSGRRVAAIDARGHGASDKPHDPESYGEARMADDLAQLIDILDEPTIDLVGYSMGAVVSLILATRDPRVRRLAIGGVGAAVAELGGVDTRVLHGPTVLEAMTTDDPDSVADQSAAGFRSFVDAVGGDRKALAAQAMAMHDSPLPLGSITAPTLLLAGSADELATRPGVLADAIPDATLRVLDGDHLGAVRQPKFSSALTDFLNR